MYMEFTQFLNNNYYIFCEILLTWRMHKTVPLCFHGDRLMNIINYSYFTPFLSLPIIMDDQRGCNVLIFIIFVV